MRGGGQEARNNNAKDAKSAKSFRYVFVLFVLFALFAFLADHYSVFWFIKDTGLLRSRIAVRNNNSEFREHLRTTQPYSSFDCKST